MGPNGESARDFGVSNKVMIFFILRSSWYRCLCDPTSYWSKKDLREYDKWYSLVKYGVHELIRYSRFQSVGNLTLHFPDNFGGETTQIYYIGLKGEATKVLSYLGFFNAN